MGITSWISPIAQHARYIERKFVCPCQAGAPGLQVERKQYKFGDRIWILRKTAQELLHMATIREYFETDPKALTTHRDWEYRSSDGQPIANVRAKIALNFDANAKYWYFYIPETKDVHDCIATLLAQTETAECVLSPEGDAAHVTTHLGGYTDFQTSKTLVFTRRLLIYIDENLTPSVRKGLVELGNQRNFHLVIRDRGYAKKRSEYEKPLAFICHDSGDKDTLVRDLAFEITKLMCPVWYDEYSLNVGDSLRESIEKGIKDAQKCILILSPNFFANKGWGKAEFDSIFTRELLDEENVVLPVWHGVGKRDVYEYSPRLADKVGLPSSLGVEELARKLSNAVKTGH